MAETPDNRLARSRRLARRCWWMIIAGVGSLLAGWMVLHALPLPPTSAWFYLGGTIWGGVAILGPILLLVRLHAPVAPRSVVRTSVVWSRLLVLTWLFGAMPWAMDLLVASTYSPKADFARLAIVLAHEASLVAAQLMSALLFLIISGSAANPLPEPRLLGARSCWRFLAAIVLLRAALQVPGLVWITQEVAVGFGWMTWSDMSELLPWDLLNWLSMAAYAAELFFIIMLAVRLRAFSQGLIVFRPGLCAFCGYDLSGLTGPRCPECGIAAG